MITTEQFTSVTTSPQIRLALNGRQSLLSRPHRAATHPRCTSWPAKIKWLHAFLHASNARAR